MSPIETANINISSTEFEESEDLTPFQVRKNIVLLLYGDLKTVSRHVGKFLVGIVFIYGLFSILQDVNLI